MSDTECAVKGCRYVGPGEPYDWKYGDHEWRLCWVHHDESPWPAEEAWEWLQAQNKEHDNNEFIEAIKGRVLLDYLTRKTSK